MVCASPIPDPDHRQAFEAMIPRITRIAKISFRHLKQEARAEAVQEVICNAWQAFARLAELGKTDVAYASALARYGVKQTRDHRKVGGRLNIKDVLGSYCQARKNVVVERLDQRDVDGEWIEAIVEDKTAGPADIAATRIDFRDYLRSLPTRQRRIARFLAKGETTSAASKKFDVSAGRISQIRTELKQAWDRFVGNDGPAANAA
jgi:hypothetical protein